MVLFTKAFLSLTQHHHGRSFGRKLEDFRVLTGSFRPRSNSWGLHMPLVCPDGAVAAYAWKRQLAGQAGASAVDRARLALNAFPDQKGRFFPHLEDEPFGQTFAGEPLVSKKLCSSWASIASHKEELTGDQKLSDVLMCLEKEAPIVRILTYQRLDWLKRASSLLSSAKENSLESSKDHSFNSSDKLRTGSLGAVAIVELVVPSPFREIVSLHPPGSTDLDAVAFFSPDENGIFVIFTVGAYLHVKHEINWKISGLDPTVTSQNMNIFPKNYRKVKGRREQEGEEDVNPKY